MLLGANFGASFLAKNTKILKVQHLKDFVCGLDGTRTRDHLRDRQVF